MKAKANMDRGSLFRPSEISLKCLVWQTLVFGPRETTVKTTDREWRTVDPDINYGKNDFLIGMSSAADQYNIMLQHWLVKDQKFLNAIGKITKVPFSSGYH